MGRKRLAIIGFLGGLLAGAAAASEPLTPEQLEATLRLQIAMAEAPGDLLSDALVVISLDSLARNGVARPRLSPEQREMIEALEARRSISLERVRARVEAATPADAHLLALDPCIGHGGLPTADCEAKRKALESLAGDNAHFHLLLASRAWHVSDDESFLRHLHAAAAAPTYDSGFNQGFGALRRRMQHVPMPVIPGDLEPAEARDAFVQNMAGVYMGGGGYGVLTPCREVSAGEEMELHQACRAIARRYAEGAQSLSELRVAQVLMDVLGTEADKERLQQRILAAQWWQFVTNQAVWAQPPGRERARRLDQYWDDMAAYGELGAMEAVVRRLDLPPEPPAGFDPVALRAPVRRGSSTPP